LKNSISRLAEEWAELSNQSEQKAREFEEAKKNLEAEFAKYK